MKANKFSINGEVKLDLTRDTVTEEDVAAGKTFHKADGSEAVGVATVGGSGGAPIEISSESEMLSILENGTVGEVYKYSGESTPLYEKDSYYLLEKSEDTDSIVGAWMLNETLNPLEEETIFYIKGYFCIKGLINSREFVTIDRVVIGTSTGSLSVVKIYSNECVLTQQPYTVFYTKNSAGTGDAKYVRFNDGRGGSSSTSRTSDSGIAARIIRITEDTDNEVFKAWLKANAVKQ